MNIGKSVKRESVYQLLFCTMETEIKRKVYMQVFNKGYYVVKQPNWLLIGRQSQIVMNALFNKRKMR